MFEERKEDFDRGGLSVNQNCDVEYNTDSSIKANSQNVAKSVLSKLFGGKKKAIQNNLETLTSLMQLYEKSLCEAQEEIEILKNELQRQKNELEKLKKSEFTDLEYDYFEFENRFRGSEEQVKKIQEDFIHFFIDKNGPIVDIGCGRGEFLELLKERDINAIGIDAYIPFVRYCKEKNLNVVGGDALDVIMEMEDESIGGVMMSHVVEHLEPKYMLNLMRTVLQKLCKGGCFVIQTPNPQSLFTYIDFYVDITHVKPVHYKALEFMFEQNGYSRIERFDPPATKFRNVVVQLYEDNSKLNLQEFNYGINNLNEYLTGYQDYAIVAYK